MRNQIGSIHYIYINELIQMDKKELTQVLKSLGIKSVNDGVGTGSRWIKSSGKEIKSYSPVDGNLIARVTTCDPSAFEKVISAAQQAFLKWRQVPAPQRGEVVRQIGNELRNKKFKLYMSISIY